MDVELVFCDGSTVTLTQNDIVSPKFVQGCPESEYLRSIMVNGITSYDTGTGKYTRYGCIVSATFPKQP